MFNAELTITAPLVSLAEQALAAADFELVLVDDGSTDGSASKARKLLETMSFQWEILEGPRKGVSAARNRGIAHARGEHVFFLDADDELPRDFLSTVLEGIERNAGDLAWTWKVFSPMEISLLRRHSMNLHSEGCACLAAYLRKPRNAQVMVRRSFLEKTGIRFTEGLAYAEDFDFFARLLLEAGRVHVEDRTFTLYRRHPRQVTRTIKRLEARKAADSTFRRLAGLFAEREAPAPVVLEMKRHAARARIQLLCEAKRSCSPKSYAELLESPETEEAIRFAGQGELSVKWQFRAAMLDIPRLWSRLGKGNPPAKRSGRPCG